VNVPLCQARSCVQQLHPLTANTPMTTNKAVSVVLLKSSFRRLLRYFCLAILASSSVNDGSPFLFLLFFSLKYPSENLRPSSSICVGVRSGLSAPWPAPPLTRRPLCGRRGGGGSALTKLYPSSSASVPLSLGDCDWDDVFLRLRPSASDIVRLGGLGRRREDAERSGEGFQISSSWRRYGCGERRKSSSVSMSEGMGASRGASGGSGSCGMLVYFSSCEDGGLYVTTLQVQQVFFIGDACASLGVAPTRMWCRGSNVELPRVEWDKQMEGAMWSGARE
jgi:hypothetical protein